MTMKIFTIRLKLILVNIDWVVKKMSYKQKYGNSPSDFTPTCGIQKNIHKYILNYDIIFDIKLKTLIEFIVLSSIFR